MKLILTAFIGLSSFFFTSSNPGQLNQTRWEGVLHVPEATAAEIEFKTDSLLIYVGGDLVETNAYEVVGDTLKMRKLNGMSSCDTLTSHYRYTIKNDVLNLAAINDNCQERKGAFSSEGYKRKK